MPFDDEFIEALEWALKALNTKVEFFENSVKALDNMDGSSAFKQRTLKRHRKSLATLTAHRNAIRKAIRHEGEED